MKENLTSVLQGSSIFITRGGHMTYCLTKIARSTHTHTQTHTQLSLVGQFSRVVDKRSAAGGQN